MVIKNKIWEEMKQAHANVLCVKWYTDKQRKHERYYQMFIALVASGGTFGYLLNEIAPLISSSIIAFVSFPKTVSASFHTYEINTKFKSVSSTFGFNFVCTFLEYFTCYRPFVFP